MGMLLMIFAFYGLAQASEEYRVVFLREQGLTAADCGRVLAAGSLLMMVAVPLAGVLADKLRSRRAVYVGVLIIWLALLGALLFTTGVSFGGVMLCALLIPLLSASCSVTNNMVEATGVNACLVTPGLDYSSVRVCLSIAYCAVNFVYTPVIRRFGPAAPFVLTIGYLLVMLALSGTVRDFANGPADAPARNARKKNRLPWGKLFGNYFLMVFIVLQALHAFGGNLQSYLPYLLEEVDVDTAMIGTANGFRVLGEILVMPLVPRIKRRVSLPMLQAVTAGFQLLQLLLCLIVPNAVVIFGAIVLSGVASGISLATMAMYMRLMAPEGLETTTLSLGSLSGAAGGVLMSLAGGAIIDTYGIFHLYRIGVIALVVWLVLYFGTWAFGVRVMKKQPPIPMFLKSQSVYKY